MPPVDFPAAHNFAPKQPSSDSTYSPSKIKVIGVGGGGNNAVNYMMRQGIDSVTFVVANTDRQALQNSPVTNRVLLGPNTLRGRGAGNDPEKARLAAEESEKDIAALFDADTDMVFITAGMGGGTGTGASPVIARVAKSMNILTIGIVTIPFLFEGPRKALKAMEGARELGKHVDALLVINNERLSEIYRDCNFLNAFGKADDILSMAAMSISEIVTCDGYINLDFNDVNTTLRNGGTAIISTGYGEGENRVTQAINAALHSPLLRNTDINTSKKLLFNLYFNDEAQDQFRIDETNQITDFISNIDQEVDVIWGVAIDKSLGEKVKFTILAAGFDLTIDHNGNVLHGNDISVSQDTAAKSPAPAAAPANIDSNSALTDMYGDKYLELQRQRNERSYAILNDDQLSSDAVISTLEQNPTLNRSKSVVDELKNKKESAPIPPPQSSAAPASDKQIFFNDII